MAFVSSNTIVTYALFFRDVALSILTIVSLFLSVLWISVFLYGSFYFFYMPSQTYEVPVNFRFDPCDDLIHPIGVKCSFLTASIQFNSKENPFSQFSLVPGQSYMVSLELELPPTENNAKMGMFMSCIQVNDLSGGKIQDKCLSAIMEQRSFLAQTLRTLLTYPFKMFTGGRERFHVNIDFYNNFQDDVHKPTGGFSFEIQSRYIDIYESRLKIHAHFSGLRYLMYYYPVFSSFLGASLIAIILSSVLAVGWKRFFEPTVIVKVDTFSDRQERAKAALAKSPSQLKVLQRVRSSQQVDNAERLSSLAEFDPARADLAQFESSADDFQGGIEIMTKAGVNQNAEMRRRKLVPDEECDPRETASAKPIMDTKLE